MIDLASQYRQILNVLEINFLLLGDPPLTQKGYIQACNVQAMYTTENSLPDGGVGIPEISYCSPEMRTMATNSITFAPLLGQPPSITTLLYDVRSRV